MKKNSPLAKVNAIKRTNAGNNAVNEIHTQDVEQPISTTPSIDLNNKNNNNKTTEKKKSKDIKSSSPLSKVSVGKKKKSEESPTPQMDNSVTSADIVDIYKEPSKDLKKIEKREYAQEENVTKEDSSKGKPVNVKSKSPLSKIKKQKKENDTLTEPNIAEPDVSPSTFAAKNSSKPVDNVLPDSNFDKYEQELEAEDLMNSIKEEKAEHRRIIFKRFVAITLVLGCVYLIFLIYGACNTKYVYSEFGDIVPQKMTLEEIEAVESFNEFSAKYLQARVIYEKALTLDYRVAAGIEDPIVVAPEYEELLEDINQLSIQIQALEVSSTYVQLKTMLENWVQTDVAVYCQRMSEAISQNNAQYAEQAIQYRNIMYNDFSLITENLVIIGQSLGCVDLENIVNWSPESFVQENIGAIS